MAGENKSFPTTNTAAVAGNNRNTMNIYILVQKFQLIYIIGAVDIRKGTDEHELYLVKRILYCVTAELWRFTHASTSLPLKRCLAIDSVASASCDLLDFLSFKPDVSAVSAWHPVNYSNILQTKRRICQVEKCFHKNVFTKIGQKMFWKKKFNKY